MIKSENGKVCIAESRSGEIVADLAVAILSVSHALDETIGDVKSDEVLAQVIIESLEHIGKERGANYE